MKSKAARANVVPVRQRTQFSCMASSMTMALKSLGIDCTEDEVAEVMGVKPMRGATWEDAIAAAQHYGCRATLVSPSTLSQIKEWTDQGDPVLIAWNPEGREWSHASVVFDVGEDQTVHVADPNIPDPEETVRVVDRKSFYSKWAEKWPRYLVRRPAMHITREITPDGRQVMASQQKYPAGFRYGDFEVVDFTPTHPKFPQGVYAVRQDGVKFPQLIAADAMDAEIAWVEKATRSHQRSQELAEQVRRKEEEERARREDTKGFADQFSPPRRAKILNALNRQRSISRKFVTLREWVPQKVKEGWHVAPHPKFTRIFEDPSGTNFYTQKDITGTAMDYAEYLTKNRSRWASQRQAEMADRFRAMNTLRQHVDSGMLARHILLRMTDAQVESFLAMLADQHSYPLVLSGHRLEMLEDALHYMDVDTVLDEMARELPDDLAEAVLTEVADKHGVTLGGGKVRVRNLSLDAFEHGLNQAIPKAARFEEGEEVSDEKMEDYLGKEDYEKWEKKNQEYGDKLKKKGYGDLPRIRRILGIASKKAKRKGSSEASSWFVMDERGTWERAVKELLEKTAPKATELGLSESAVDDQISDHLVLQAFETILRRRRASETSKISAEEFDRIVKARFGEGEDVSDAEMREYLGEEDYKKWKDKNQQYGDKFKDKAAVSYTRSQSDAAERVRAAEAAWEKWDLRALQQMGMLSPREVREAQKAMDTQGSMGWIGNALKDRIEALKDVAYKYAQASDPAAPRRRIRLTERKASRRVRLTEQYPNGIPGIHTATLKAERITADRLVEEFRDLEWEDAQKLAQAISKASKRNAWKVLQMADKMLDNFGVEALRNADDPDEEVALYVNTGDTYNPTLVYDVGEDEFFLTDWGTWVQNYERKGGRIRAASWDKEPSTVDEWLSWEA